MRYAGAGRYSQTASCFFGLRRLAQWRDVIENPEGAAVRSDDQIVAVNRKIADGSRRQIELQRLPVVAVIERHVDPEFCSGKQQIFFLRIFANAAQKSMRRNAIGNQLPGRTIVASSIEIGRSDRLTGCDRPPHKQWRDHSAKLR